MDAFKPEISQKFKEIKNAFNNLINDSFKSPINNYNSHLNLHNRPYLPVNINKSISAKDLHNILEQIGNNNLNICDDKLLTNIKIESYETVFKKNTLISINNDTILDNKRRNRTNSKSVNNRKINRQKKKLIKKRNILNDFPISKNSNTLELNCNKKVHINNIYKKKQNKYLQKENTANKNISIRNLNQFINKPIEADKCSIKNIIISPKNNSKVNQNDRKLIKNRVLNTFKRKNNNFDNNNETISICSTTRSNISKNNNRGKSMSSMYTNKNISNFRLPNKSIIKNQDKIIIELQKLFGEKIQLNDDIYLIMNDSDKKNCINFLLEIIKEVNNINKINKSKYDGYKQIIESKEQQIKNEQREIKELKKEIVKLNKLIKNNNQVYKKLSQDYEQLKLKLEKEKIKNKNMQIRDKSNSNIHNIYSNKNKNINKNNIDKENKSQDKIKKSNIVDVKKKKERSFDKKIDIKNNNIFDNTNNNNYEKINSNIIWKNNKKKKEDISTNSIIEPTVLCDLKYNILTKN